MIDAHVSAPSPVYTHVRGEWEDRDSQVCVPITHITRGLLSWEAIIPHIKSPRWTITLWAPSVCAQSKAHHKRCTTGNLKHSPATAHVCRDGNTKVLRGCYTSAYAEYNPRPFGCRTMLHGVNRKVT